MTLDTIAPAERPSRPQLRDLALRGVTWALLSTCVALLAALVISGERTTSYADLRGAVADGSVQQVRVVGNGPVFEVHWRSGLLGRVSEVSSGERPAADLAAIDPGALVIERERTFAGYSEMGSWRAPSWVLSLAALVQVGTIWLLILAPEPRRATRWAWFWLLWLAFPLGTLACLLNASVPQQGARPGRRLTGGWAFALTFVGAGLLATLAAAIV